MVMCGNSSSQMVSNPLPLVRKKRKRLLLSKINHLGQRINSDVQIYKAFSKISSYPAFKTTRLLQVQPSFLSFQGVLPCVFNDKVILFFLQALYFPLSDHTTSLTTVNRQKILPNMYSFYWSTKIQWEPSFRCSNVYSIFFTKLGDYQMMPRKFFRLQFFSKRFPFFRIFPVRNILVYSQSSQVSKS